MVPKKKIVSIERPDRDSNLESTKRKVFIAHRLTTRPLSVTIIVKGNAYFIFVLKDGGILARVSKRVTALKLHN